MRTSGRHVLIKFRTMKIAYVIDSLASKGGAERIVSDKLNYMAEHYGYDVYVITCYQNQQQDPNTYYLSEKVSQINLNISYYRQYRYRYPQRLWVKWTIYRRLIQVLKNTVQQIDPDVLVGLGYFMADVVTGMPCRALKLVESHDARSFSLLDKGSKRSFWSKVYMRLYRKYYLKKVERRADLIVTLSNAEAKEWMKAKRVEVIPNFTVMPVLQQSTCQNKRVMAAGRLEWQKGFDRLIASWAKVHDKHSDWHLHIFGSGTMQHQLTELITFYSLEEAITIHPYTSAIDREYSDSSIFALSSRFEGFGLVLLEAMQSGLPCVTFDCPYGPSEVVVDNQTGFVVNNGDVDAFADRLCCLIEDEVLRKRFSEASVRRAKHYDVEMVMNQWKTLLESLLR